MTSEVATVRWRWLRSRLAKDPAWIGRWGLRFAAVVLVASLVALLALPLLGVALLASTLVVVGVAELSDFAVRGQAALDPRLATLLLLAGVGNWLVLALRLL